MAMVKGTAVKASLAFVASRAGEDRLARIIAALPPPYEEMLSGPVLQGNWYEFSTLLALMDASAPFVTPVGSKSLAWEMGRFSADFGLKSIYKVFFRLADPGFIIHKASQVFDSYYRPGTMIVERAAPQEALLRLTGFDQPSPVFCDRLLGWMERTLELCGAKEICMEHPRCLSRGDASCDYMGRWV